MLMLAGAVGLDLDQPSRVATPTSAVSAGIGHSFAGLTAKAITGSTVALPVTGAKATVIALTSTTCPLCQKFGPTLAGIENAYLAKGVKFVFVNPSELESTDDMKSQVKRLGLDGSYVRDKSLAWVKKLGAKTTTETFLLDASGKLCYRGAIDDQYSLGATLPKARHHYLNDALDAVLAGKTPKVQATSAPGCVLAESSTTCEGIPTFHGRIQHIIQANCMSCHHDGGPAPFSLDGYPAVKGRAKMLQYVTKQGIMPPWFAAKGAGPWRNDMTLSDSDKAALDSWIAGGMPKGDPKEAPAPVKYVTGWTIGQPDATFQLPQPISIPASGVMPYQNVVVPTGFTEDKWVEKIEVVPGDRRAVHHVLVFVTYPGGGVQAGQDEGLSGFFGIYVPGNSALTYAPGLAKRLPKGSVLRFQIHYTPYGTATKDQTKIGFVYAKQPPKSEVHSASLVNLRFAIPPGADNYPVEAHLRVPADVQVLSFLPHMHVRGKSARYELTSGGKTKTLLDVPHYDFNWQLNYVLKTPLDLKAGDSVSFMAHYDNSDKNPANPDPTKTVRWGQQTFEEMHLGYLEYIVPGEKPGEGTTAAKFRPNLGLTSAEVEAVFRRFDRNGDGFLTKDEAPLVWDRIKEADTNGDGKVSLAEAKAFLGGG